MMGERHQTDTSEPQVDYDFTGSGVLVIKLSGNWTLKESPRTQRLHCAAYRIPMKLLNFMHRNRMVIIIENYQAS
jgi:hypothetical protein